MNEKQKKIILAMLDIEHIFEEYQDKIDVLLKDNKMIEEKVNVMIINSEYNEQLINIFEDIYEALDN